MLMAAQSGRVDVIEHLIDSRGCPHEFAYELARESLIHEKMDVIRLLVRKRVLADSDLQSLNFEARTRLIAMTEDI